MDKLFNYFQLFLLSISGVLLLCILFAVNPELANGIRNGRVCWFHFSALLFALSVLFMELTSRKSRYFFSLPDILLLFTFGFALFTYNQEENLQPEKLIFAAQLAVLWFMLRSALQIHPELRMFYITIITLTGLVASVLEIRNIYTVVPATLPIDKMVQEMTTQETFVGYLAVILPICLNTVLRFKDCDKYTWWETRTFLFYFSGITTLLISTAVLMRPSQSYRLAAIISCIWICWIRLIGWNKTSKFIKKHQCLFAITSIIFIFVWIGFALSGSVSKAETGSRRLLIWNVTTKAIMEHPIGGTGVGGFPITYAQTQASYFSSGIASEKEKQNAICPDYAYNEYLQIGLESGIGGLLLFMLWLAFSLFYGIKNRQAGASGGIVSLSVFAMYSYPLQLSSFWILLLFLAAICVTDLKQKPLTLQSNIPYIGIWAAIISCFLYFEQRNSFNTYKEWKNVRDLYHDKAYRIAAPQYATLFSKLQHQVDFLQEGADCFSQTGDHETAILWLEYALKLSADPEIYYELARHEKELGRYENAEYYLEIISRILPAKGYTYYMLALLYAEPNFSQPNKLFSAAHKVLNMQHIRQSGVTEEMRNGINKLLQEMELQPDSN